MALNDLEFDKNAICYMNNPLLRAANAAMPISQEHIEEIKKCRDDIIYFVRNYVKIITLDQGPQLFELHDYQEEWIKACKENRFVMGKWSRQSGKCVTGNTRVKIRHDGQEKEIKIKELLSLA